MVLLYALGIVVLINCFYFILFSKFSFLQTSENNTKDSYPVSLIICAKDEAKNLKKNIPLWLAQDHPNFEIILINDASMDDTLEVIKSFANKDPRISIVNLENNEAFWGSKKYALTLGIKQAKNKRMLFTDADCRPSSEEWITNMSSNFSKQKQLILGYGAYEKSAGLLNALIRYETLITAAQYFSYAKAGIPYMGVGRNLGYTSDLYYSTNGFMSHMKIPSGDDDLFVNEAATRENIEICCDINAFTYSEPKESWKAWKVQKKRHISTAKFYKSKHKILLGIYYTFNLVFWLLAGICFLLLDWKIPLFLIGVRILVQSIILGKAALKLKEKNLIPFIPFLELFLVFIQLSIFISNSVSKPSRWK